MPRVSSTSTLYKKAEETRTYSMDFSNLMATGETIEEAAPVPVVSQERMGGSVSTDLTIGAPSVDGQEVIFAIAGGDNGKIYRLDVLITTSTGQILEGDGILHVRD